MSEFASPRTAKHCESPVSWVSPSEGSTYATGDKILAKWRVRDKSPIFTSSPTFRICRSGSDGWHTVGGDVPKCGHVSPGVVKKSKGNSRSTYLTVPEVTRDGTYILRAECNDSGLISRSPAFSLIANTVRPQASASEEDPQSPFGSLSLPYIPHAIGDAGHDINTNTNNTLPKTPQLLVNNKPTTATVALVVIPLSIVAFLVLALVLGVSIRRLRNRRTTVAEDLKAPGPQSAIGVYDAEKAGGVIVPHPLFMPIDLGDLPRLTQNASWESSSSSSKLVTHPTCPPIYTQSYTQSPSSIVKSETTTATTTPANSLSSAYTLPPINIEPTTPGLHDDDDDFDEVELECPNASVSNVSEVRHSSTVMDYFQPSAPWCDEVVLPLPPKAEGPLPRGR